MSAQGSKISKGGGCSGLASPTPVSIPSPPHHRPLEAEGSWLGGVLVASASQEKRLGLYPPPVSRLSLPPRVLKDAWILKDH